MDSVSEIKARLPIEDLVAKYCQLQKKGRSFVCLCPFHSDSRPSLLVSPDKGIAYCFACQKGGDIFSFYQTIEGVDFREALKDLAEMTGVKVEHAASAVKKDEKERARECLEAALRFYQDQLKQLDVARSYVQKRDIPPELIERFQIGYAPDAYTPTYDHLLKLGFSRTEILAAGLGIQRELAEERIIDRFRNRLMFPIHDGMGKLIGFGGRTLGDDPAKYINSAEGILYHKSNVLYGLHLAKEAMREQRSVVVVEGYMDLLACHRVGVTRVVATCGTSLTEQHGKLLRRTCDEVILCLDSDRAGRDAAERAFLLLSAQGLHIQRAVLREKDPDEAAKADPAFLKESLTTNAQPYIDTVLTELSSADLSSPLTQRQELQRLLGLLRALPFAVERQRYLAKAAELFGTTDTAIAQDLAQVRAPMPSTAPPSSPARQDPHAFSKVEMTLLLFLFYPSLRPLLSELVPPEEGLAADLYHALKELPDGATPTLAELPVADEHRERVGILLLYGEQCGFADWSEPHALRELRKHCSNANKELLQHRMEDITKKLVEVATKGDSQEKALLEVQYQQVIKLMQMAK